MSLNSESSEIDVKIDWKKRIRLSFVFRFAPFGVIHQAKLWNIFILFTCLLLSGSSSMSNACRICMWNVSEIECFLLRRTLVCERIWVQPVCLWYPFENQFSIAYNTWNDLAIGFSQSETNRYKGMTFIRWIRVRCLLRFHYILALNAICVYKWMSKRLGVSHV